MADLSLTSRRERSEAMKRFIVLIAMLIAATAAADDHTVAVTPFAGYRFGGELDIQQASATLDIDDATSFGLLVNVDNDAKTTWEVLYSQQQTEATVSDPALNVSSVDTDIHILQLGGTYHGDGDNVQPYVALTLGGTHVRTSGTDSESDTFWSGSIGVGLDVRPSSRLGLRIEARAYGTLTDSNTELFCRTGPDLNICAIRIESNLLSQIEAFAGFTLRF